MDALLDASAIMAIILNEPNRDIVVKLTKGATLLSPEMISFEIGNALISLFKRHKLNETEVLKAYENFTKIPIRTLNPDMGKALKISCNYTIYAYDAYYLETAYRLKLPLITFDKNMAAVGKKMKITILNGEKNEGV
ncbi:type II toxin-antitoxin system VapC family toxin [Treponema primitia]|uniref:type II toxin-antitoxin system VapC family toxin n=1 Tax=Treponema primitia TaxID=88058 RepID=UPI00398164EB